ncbi:MAG: CaiB/BaiF CoA-transferase family protein [Alphaproteobacteria bacterium]
MDSKTESSHEAAGPLAGMRILDMSRILAGPFCTQLLGDYGADVIKVERAGGGDDTRSWGPPYVVGKDGKATDESAYYLAANRNKRSIAIDISDPEGAATVRQLVRSSDVFIENFKVGGLEKYGLGYDTLSAENPSLIYCSITGFGQTGPNAHRPGYDLLAQAFGGIMSLTGEPDGQPMKVAVGIADVVCGLYAVTAILAAAQHRATTGEGQHIDIALIDTQISWLINEGTNFLVSGEAPARRGNQHPNIVPYQVFRAHDGHVVVAAGNDEQFRRLCQMLARPDLANDPRFQTNSARVMNREVLVPVLSRLIAPLERSWLVERLEEFGIPGGAINAVPEVFESEQVSARDMRVQMPHSLAASGHVDLIGNPVKFSRTPVAYRLGPPYCGEHTDEILQECLDDQNKYANP